MKEYIERERLKEAFNADLQTLQSLDEHTMNLILIEIDEAPAADVAPVRYGKWTPADQTGDCCYTCSECGFERDAYLLDVGNYCPNCGARMDVIIGGTG